MQLGYDMAIALSKCVFKCLLNVFNLLIDCNCSGERRPADVGVCPPTRQDVGVPADVLEPFHQRRRLLRHGAALQSGRAPDARVLRVGQAAV